MPELAFNTTVTFWRLAADHGGVIRSILQTGEWTFGDAITHVISQPGDEQWRFAVVHGAFAIDHLDMLRLANTNTFEQWQRR